MTSRIYRHCTRYLKYPYKQNYFADSVKCASLYAIALKQLTSTSTNPHSQLKDRLKELVQGRLHPAASQKKKKKKKTEGKKEIARSLQ